MSWVNYCARESSTDYWSQIRKKRISKFTFKRFLPPTGLDWIGLCTESWQSFTSSFSIVRTTDIVKPTHRTSLKFCFPWLGEPLVASVWRRQTFSAAVDSLNPAMSLSLFHEHMKHVFSLINPTPTIRPDLETVLDASYVYSRMLHKSYSPGGALEGSGFYRSFVCQVGSPLDPTQLGEHRTFGLPIPSKRRWQISIYELAELIKKCYRTERGESISSRVSGLWSWSCYVPFAGEPERVGACLFPGLVKETAIDTTPLPQTSIRHGPGAQNRAPTKKRETRTLVVRRAQVICEWVALLLYRYYSSQCLTSRRYRCALAAAYGAGGVSNPPRTAQSPPTAIAWPSPLSFRSFYTLKASQIIPYLTILVVLVFPLRNNTLSDSNSSNALSVVPLEQVRSIAKTTSSTAESGLLVSARRSNMRTLHPLRECLISNLVLSNAAVGSEVDQTF